MGVMQTLSFVRLREQEEMEWEDQREREREREREEKPELVEVWVEEEGMKKELGEMGKDVLVSSRRMEGG